MSAELTANFRFINPAYRIARPGMLMIPTSVADVSCHAVSPEFSQLGASFRADNIWDTSPQTLPIYRHVQRHAPCHGTLSEPGAPFFGRDAQIHGLPSVHRARVTLVAAHRQGAAHGGPASDGGAQVVREGRRRIRLSNGERRDHRAHLEVQRGDRPAGEVSLRAVTAEQCQQLQRCERLDSLGDDNETECVTEFDRGSDELEILLASVRTEPANKRPV